MRLICLLLSLAACEGGVGSSSQLTTTALRAPSGVYAKITVDQVTNDYYNAPSPPAATVEDYFDQICNTMLADPAISGISLGVKWSALQPSPTPSPSPYSWDYLDITFRDVVAYNQANSGRNKTVVLNIVPGFSSPDWLTQELGSCDPGFKGKPFPSPCGTITFKGAEETPASPILPVPWNSDYQNEWFSFLSAMNQHLRAKPAWMHALVAITIAGPTGASPEMILPNNPNTSPQPWTQPPNELPNDMWSQIISAQAQPTGDESFIKAWTNTIGQFQTLFSDVTLRITPDVGTGFPSFSANYGTHDDNTLYSQMCYGGTQHYRDNNGMSCEAATEVMSQYVANKSIGHVSSLGGLVAQTSNSEDDGFIGLAGLKLLSQQGLSVVGAMVDHPVSIDTAEVGCPAGYDVSDPFCTCLIPEQALFTTLQTFFTNTGAPAPLNPASGTATMNFLDVSYRDVLYAVDPAHANPMHTCNTTVPVYPMQKLLKMASDDLAAIAVPTAP